MGSWWEAADRQTSDGDGEKDCDGNLQEVLTNDWFEALSSMEQDFDVALKNASRATRHSKTEVIVV